MWPNSGSTGEAVPLDSLVWSSIAFILHSWAFLVLLVDEREGKRFDDDDTESLYRFFLNRSGISRRDFHPIFTKGKWTRISRVGSNIDTDKELFVLVEGSVDVEIEGWHRRQDLEISPDGPVAKSSTSTSDSEPYKIRLYSGELFDLRLANVFRVPVGFFNKSFGARTASENVLLFSWPIEALEEFSTKSPPVIIQAWRNMIAFAVADIAHRPLGSDEDRQAQMNGHRQVDFTVPREDSSSNEKTIRNFFWWLIKSMDPRPLPGMRRAAVPVLSSSSAAAVYNDPRMSSIPTPPDLDIA